MSQRTICKYRVFCSSDNEYKYIWSETPPKKCPSDETHSLNLASLSIIDSVQETKLNIGNVSFDSYGNLQVTEKTPILELKSCFGISALRDSIETVGTGGLTNLGNSEYDLQVIAPNDVVILKSAERCNYVAGSGAEFNIGVRVPSIAAHQTAEWGVYDGKDGFLFRLSVSGIALVTCRNGVETTVSQNEFNCDKLDGNGESGVIYNASVNIMYSIVYSWNGYVDFRIVATDKFNVLRAISIHKCVPSIQPYVNNPTLPFYACLKNMANYDAPPSHLLVADRNYSILGKYNPVIRSNAAYCLDCPVFSSGFKPIISIRRKNSQGGNIIRLSSGDFTASCPQIVQIRLGCRLIGDSFENINDQLVAETAVEMDRKAAELEGGIVVWTGMISGDHVFTQHFESLRCHLLEYTPITVCAKSIKADGHMTMALRWCEEW